MQNLIESLLKPAILSINLGEALFEPSSASVLPAGKRARPVLCMATTEALGFPAEKAASFALALELIHNSSLIHDDLPALDNDDFRRGEPTCHKRFGEAVAILTGDALILGAFALVSRPEIPAEVSRSWNGLLAEAGLRLCVGQALDLAVAGKVTLEKPVSADEKTLENICLQKTAALFRAAVLGPAALLGAEGERGVFPALDVFGTQLGLLFQLTDDLLDDGDFVTRYGREATVGRCDAALEKAVSALGGIPGDASFLVEFARMVRERKA